MRTIRLRIVRGVTLPGGVDALPGAIEEVEERFGRGLLFDRRAVPADDVLDMPLVDAETDPEPEPEPRPQPATSQDRDPRPINRDPSRRRQGPRR